MNNCRFCGRSLDEPAPMLPFGNYGEGEAVCLLAEMHREEDEE